jgi:hypothetical protein
MKNSVLGSTLHGSLRRVRCAPESLYGVPYSAKRCIMGILSNVFWTFSCVIEHHCFSNKDPKVWSR